MNRAQAAVFVEHGRPLELREIELPELNAGEALVRVAGCTICGSDLHTYDGRRETPTPTILGHEIVGEVAAVAAENQPLTIDGQALAVGDRVTWSIVANCGACFYCERQLPQKCERGEKYGHVALSPGRELLGGLAEYCLLPEQASAVRLPEALPLEVACPASCATATVMAALDAAGDIRHRNVCVFGLGLLGLTACAAARDRGAASVVAVDVHEGRRNLAKSFGATEAMQPSGLEAASAQLTGGRGFDVAFEVSGAVAAAKQSIDLLRMGGVAVLVGAVFPTDPIALPPERIVRRNISIIGVHNYRPSHLSEAVAFLERRGSDFPFASLVAQWFPLDQVDQAFEASREPNSIRVGVKP